MSLPSFDGDSPDIVIEKRKVEEIAVKPKPNMHVRKEGTLEFPCFDEKCDKVFKTQGARTNHMVTHLPKLTKVYSDSDMLILEVEVGKSQFDTQKEWTVQGISLPDGYKFHSILARQTVIKGHKAGMKVLVVKDPAYIKDGRKKRTTTKKEAKK